MKRIAFIGATAIVLLTAWPSGANELGGNCALKTPVQEVHSVLQMAPEVRKLVAPMADPGSPFQSTDVIEGRLPTRRLIRAGHRGNDWFVWYEQGGVAYSWQAIVVRIAPGGGGATKLVHALVPVAWRDSGWTPSIDLCAFTDAALAGRVPPYPRGTMEIKQD